MVVLARLLKGREAAAPSLLCTEGCALLNVLWIRGERCVTIESKEALSDTTKTLSGCQCWEDLLACVLQGSNLKFGINFLQIS